MILNIKWEVQVLGQECITELTEANNNGRTCRDGPGSIVLVKPAADEVNFPMRSVVEISLLILVKMHFSCPCIGHGTSM